MKIEIQCLRVATMADCTTATVAVCAPLIDV